jgi:hypothetical protein
LEDENGYCLSNQCLVNNLIKENDIVYAILENQNEKRTIVINDPEELLIHHNNNIKMTLD